MRPSVVTVHAARVTVTARPPSTTRRPARHLGPFGTVARLALGSWMLVHAIQTGVRPVDALFGLVIANALIVALLAARGAGAAPLRFTGPVSHAINIVLALTTLSAFHVPALLFYGSASLLAAARGYGGCEMFAVANWLRRRDDQFGCPFYLPADVVDHELNGRRD